MSKPYLHAIQTPFGALSRSSARLKMREASTCSQNRFSKHSQHIFSKRFRTSAHAGEPFFHVDWRVMNSKMYGGVPQNRNRLYIVGASREHGPLSSEFWPKPLPTPSLTSILDLRTSKRRPELPSSPVALRKYMNIMQEFKAARVNPRKHPICIDFDASKARTARDLSFCLTATRGKSGGYFVTCLGRKFTVHEMMRLQGISEPEALVVNCSKQRMGHMIGNSFTQSVFERLFIALLPRLVPSGSHFTLRNRF